MFNRNVPGVIEVWSSFDGMVHARVLCPECGRSTEVEIDQREMPRQVAVFRGEILWDDDMLYLFVDEARRRCPCFRKRKPLTEAEKAAAMCRLIRRQQILNTVRVMRAMGVAR